MNNCGCRITITQLPIIKPEYVEEFKELIKLSKTADKYDEHYENDYLVKIKNVTDSGILIMPERKGMWQGDGVFATFLSKYVRDDNVYTFSLIDEMGFQWCYKYVYGKMFASDVLIGNKDKLKECLSMLQNKNFNIDLNIELRSFQLGLRFAYNITYDIPIDLLLR